MNTDTPATPATSEHIEAREVHTPASGLLTLSTPTGSDATTPTGSDATTPHNFERDAAYYRKREDTLRATGEILHQRCIAKLERLNQLKQEVAKKQQASLKSKHHINSLQDQQLAILRAEEARLIIENKKIQANKKVFPEILPEVSKLRVRQTVQDSILEYEFMIPYLKQELEETQAELAGENKLFKELREIKRALEEKRKDLATAWEAGSNQKSSQDRTKMLEIKVLVQELMRELTGFLAKYYPPIQSDDNDGTVYDLKLILEDIMNLSVSRPADPYLELIPGEYHPPHVEQLINAGIAVRHPRDAQRLRLVDFYS
ncbi:hypothetical protein FBU30_004143 [Linnemannia zychae]|nr:hypothetical protein FBU30_004143 [Linnemannia zychae]